MLTAEHVRASKKRGELVLRPLQGSMRERAAELAEAYLDIAQANVGASRDEIKQAWTAVPIVGQEKRLADGLLKLIDDACEFSTESPADPAELRAAIFTSAAERRLRDDAPFDRAAVLADAALSFGLSADDLDRALYSDLRGAHVLLRVQAVKPEQLLARYDRGQVQAVLLRAVRVVADVFCRSAAGYRYLFRQLKFRRLLHRITEKSDGGYRIEIDGPYSLFDSVTKYGLQLALVLPALQACDRLHLVADIRWGKAREPLAFRFEASSVSTNGDEGDGTNAAAPSEMASLGEGFAALESAWRAAPASEILELPGVGLCIPDLVFEHRNGARVFFEALGYWSRDAVWQRVELVQRGLDAPILFAVSEKLRVSEAVLDPVDHAALYVYKTTMNPRAIERKLDELLRGLAHPPKSK